MSLCNAILLLLATLVQLVISTQPRSNLLQIAENADLFLNIKGACTSNTKWPPKDPKSDKTDQVPMSAMCGYCQNAVYSVAMGGGAGTGCSTATDNGMEACEILTKEIDKKSSDIQKFYEERVEELGNGGGWSLEFCLTLKCCGGK